MTSIFDRAEAQASLALDRVHSEVVTVQCMASGVNTRPAPDTARRDFTAMVVFVENMETDAARDLRPSDKKIDAVGAIHWITVDLRGLSEPVVRGDVVTRHKTRHRYRIKAINPDGEGRLRLMLQLLTAETLNSLTR